MSHQREIARAHQIDGRLEAIINGMYPELRDKLIEDFENRVKDNASYSAFRQTYPPEDFNHIYFGSGRPFASVGNGFSAATGGLFGGPTSIRRDVYLAMIAPETDFSRASPYGLQMEPKVKITIEEFVPWRLFAGSTRTTIHDHKAPDNSTFLSLLTKHIKDSSLHFEIRK